MQQTTDENGRAFFELAPTPPSFSWRCTVNLGKGQESYLLKNFTLDEGDTQVNLALL